MSQTENSGCGLVIVNLIKAIFGGGSENSENGGDTAEAAAWEEFENSLSALVNPLGGTTSSAPQLLIGNTNIIAPGASLPIGHVWTTKPGDYSEKWRLNNFAPMTSGAILTFKFDSGNPLSWPYINSPTIQSPDRRAGQLIYEYEPLPTTSQINKIKPPPSTVQLEYEVKTGDTPSSASLKGRLYRVIANQGTATERFRDFWVLYQTYEAPNGSHKMYLVPTTLNSGGLIGFLNDALTEQSNASDDDTPFKFVRGAIAWAPQVDDPNA